MNFTLVLFGILSALNYVFAELMHVHFLFRHGDRSPMHLFPNDFNDAHLAWPDGFAQLTKRGMKQHYLLGLHFRSRYEKFFPSLFHRKHVVVHSTDVDRTLESALTHMAGLFYPYDDLGNRFNYSMPWLPVPIHTTKSNLDALMGGKNICPRINQSKREISESEVVKEMMEENKDFLSFLALYSGFDDVDIKTLCHLYDTLLCESRHHLAAPTWLTQSVWDRMAFLKNWYWSTLFKNAEYRRLYTGMILRDIRNRMKEKQQGHSLSVGSKLAVYSGHDDDVAALLSALHIYNGLQPPYASTIILELHKDHDKWFVRTFYHNTSDEGKPDHPSYPMRIPFCSSIDCPFEEFLKLTEPETFASVKEFSDACKLKGYTAVIVIANFASEIYYVHMYRFALLLLACLTVLVPALFFVLLFFAKAKTSFATFASTKKILY